MLLGEMDPSDKLEACKIDIRSILIPHQKGRYLPDFKKDYRELIGRRLPAQELGFRSEIDFLYSLPDVVRISQSRNGEYHLMAIADETTKHIQKMVQRQKPMKLKPPPPRYGRQNFTRYPNLPPRLSSKVVSVPSVCQKPVPREPTPPPPQPSRPSRVVQSNNNIEPEQEVGPMQRVISLVQSFNGLAVDDLLFEYKRRFNKSLSLSLYGFSSIEECIENIEELKVIRRNNVNFVVHRDALPNTFDNGVGSPYPQDYSQSSDRIPTPEPPKAVDSNFIENGDCDNGNVPNAIRKKFQKVAERFHDGCWAADFLSCYEEVTSETLDIQELGYTCLSDLIDDVPDIFVRQPIPGSRKDYHIFPAQEVKSVVNNTVTHSTASLQCVGAALVDHIVLNLKKILEAYPEGVYIDELLNIYSINCKDVLHVEDLGFNNLETFLSSIKSRVPLRFDVINGKKSIHLLKLCDNTIALYDTAPEVCENEAIPFDAVFPDFQFKSTTLPDDYDSSMFIPVYTSAVGCPNALYIQLQDDKTEEYKKMAFDMDTFYDGSQSELYMMKNIHIKQGASCVAKWPSDGHWYRVQIVSIPSMGNVKVYYVDFGTKDIIPKFLLRYAKKEFIELPTQAIKCRLACLKPPNNAQKFPKEARNRILSLCEDVQLMGRFTELGDDGLYSIILCNTIGDEDIYINDVLLNEKLAEVDSKENNIVEPIETHNSYAFQLGHQAQIENPPILPLQALQAQYYLKAFAAIAPSFAQNENYLALLMQISAYCPNVDPVQQNVGIPLVAPAAPPGFNTSVTNRNTNPSGYGGYSANTGGVSGIAFGGSPVKNLRGMSPTLSKTGQLMRYPNDHVFALPNSAEISSRSMEEYDNDVFDDDDDDEMFLQFCEEVSSTKARRVKRVHLCDHFKVHIIVFESKPYASSGDISVLIWNNKEADYLLRRLQHKDIDFPTVTLSEDGNEELFQQLDRYNVKGVQKTTGFKSSVLLYPLKDVIKILNLFGHPSVTLRTRLADEIANFDPNDPCWDYFSPEDLVSEDDQVSHSETDDDKIQRLCLNDLELMKKSLIIKKKKILSGSTESNCSSESNEIKKLDLLGKKIAARIQEVKEICRSFS